MAKNIIERFYSSSRWCKLITLLTFIMIAFILYKKAPILREGFIQREKFILKRGADVYDRFYASLYDELIFDKVKNEYEVGEIIQNTHPTQKSLILDVGAGTGDHVALFSAKKLHAIGIDASPAMVMAAQKKYPNETFEEGSVTNIRLFPAYTFTHITCFYFTLYYIQDKLRFFKNCYEWLQPGGYLVLHLVDRNMFDPILGVANPLVFISPQKHAKKRITTSVVKFNGFDYKGEFILNKSTNKAIFEETFKDPQGKVRKNEHIMYMPTQQHIIQLAKDTGFILEGKIDLIPVEYEYQYLYVFYKPS